ncbi:MAG: SLOG family protein [Clostridia bacterium]
MESKVCSFFGHRTIQDKEKIIDFLKEKIKNLIVNFGVNTFLFGSRSEFDTLCHSIVTDLKEKYPHIKRISYTCRSECATLEKEKKYLEEIYSTFHKQKVTLLGFEKEHEHKTKWNSGRASYVKRNQAMIDDSDYCIFYYDENYKPEMRKYSKQSFCNYQPKSGTALAYKYAKQKKKNIVNIFNTKCF